MRDSFEWARLLAFVTGLVNQELLLRNEYLAPENRTLRAHLPSRLRLTNPERLALAEVAKRLGRKALKEGACVAQPDTILGWYRRLIGRNALSAGTMRMPFPDVVAGSPSAAMNCRSMRLNFAEVLQSRMWRSDTLCGDAAIKTSIVQGTTFRSRNNPSMCALVSSLWS